jgi:hypothetical protein
MFSGYPQNSEYDGQLATPRPDTFGIPPPPDRTSGKRHTRRSVPPGLSAKFFRRQFQKQGPNFAIPA